MQQIPEQELRRDGPVKETNVGGVSKDPVNAVRDEHVILLFGRLNQVVEGLSRRGHGCGADGLRDHPNGQACQRHPFPIETRKEAHAQPKLRPRGQGCRCVGSRMVDQKGIGRRLGWIVNGRDKKFCQVKGAQACDVGAPLSEQLNAICTQVRFWYIKAWYDARQVEGQLVPQNEMKSPHKA